MIDLHLETLDAYLKDAFGPTAELVDAGDLAALDKQGIKRFGYGKPILVRYRVDKKEREAVLSVMKGDKYGHQFYWDRAAILMFQYEAGERLEKHVRALGLGYVDEHGRLVHLQRPREFFILNEKLPGYDYVHDIERVRKTGLTDYDRATARELARYLARIHGRKHDDPHLYFRRVRELIGSSECIMGLLDEAFPRNYELFDDTRARALEKRLIDRRYALLDRAHRLSVVHGDFHPWNVLVQGEKHGDPADFHVLDRSRGEFGEPAGDVCTMAANYLLFSLLDHGRLKGDLAALHDDFLATYLETTGDTELPAVIAPFYVFRALVIASPEWYPDHPPGVREKLLRFVENVLEEERFDWEHVNRYLE